MVRSRTTESGDQTGRFVMTKWPFYWISRVTARYQLKMEAALKPLGLDVARWRVLMALEGDEPASVSEIAEMAISKLPTIFVMTKWPFYWISRVTARYQLKMEAALKPLGLDVARWRVLMALEGDEPASVSEIAEMAISKLPTMTKIVQRMQAEGLVVCGVRETDGRVTEVTLTSDGKKAREQAWRVANRIYLHSFSRMPPGEVEMLNALLRKVFDELQT